MPKLLTSNGFDLEFDHGVYCLVVDPGFLVMEGRLEKNFPQSPKARIQVPPNTFPFLTPLLSCKSANITHTHTHSLR
ncbi:hypothetical protein L6452_31618 [Arctium lappa]|uniref:Uncharacterized protein n=1 Tax=Arctium lappa TaxID=4217 RepID=A0ACB8Z2X9_ARCLA|nr:hypothetical protein L6452_31618 [Arctium lappa]